MYFFSLRASTRTSRVYWAAEIPVIPDSISRRSERRQQDAAVALRSALAAQRSWLARLHNDDTSKAVSLRYISFAEGEARHLRLGFAGRAEGRNEAHARAEAREHWDTFRAVFPDTDYPLVPASTAEEFARIFLPFYPQTISELRRHDQIASLVDSYLPSPYSSESLSDMQAICQALIAAKEDHMVAINLRATSLTDTERALIADEAKRLGELKQKTIQRSAPSVGFGVTTHKLVAEAELGEQAYRKLANSLRQPFELAVLVGSPAALSTGVLRALAAEAIRVDERSGSHLQLDPRTAVAEPANLGEQLAAFKNLFEVGFERWGNSIAPVGLERLPHLIPLEEAHALFRLPVPDEEGVYGLPCSAFPQAINSGRRKALRTEPSVSRKDEIPFGGVNLRRDDFTQHVLVTGVPGTGKTNSCLYMLDRLWNGDPLRPIPFLVLEPAKFEYRGLLGTPKINQHLLIFSAGDERIAPMRFNPFAVPQGISLEAHIGRLLDIFRASMAMWGPLPAILEKLIRRLYRLKGWRYVGPCDDCEPPKMSELYDSIGPGIRDLHYSADTENEAIAALEVRVGRLCEGSLGKMLNTSLSTDFDDVMQRPTVIEIANIGNTDDRAFIMALLLNRLYQYWIVHKDHAGEGLKHVTLIEEAHNLLANFTTQQVEGQANPKGEALQQFANMIAEIRSFGEGLIIADQSPSKLIPDIVKMTGTKIAHAVVAEEDRETLKTSMNLTEEQRYQLALLPLGNAVVFQGRTATCAQVRVPNFKDHSGGFSTNVPDQEVRRFSAQFRETNFEVYLPTPGCAHCPAQCLYDEHTDTALTRLGSRTERQLEKTLRRWWHDVIYDAKDAIVPYPIFERALQRVHDGHLEASESHVRAFCAMTKLSHRYVREIVDAQFMGRGSIGRVHRAVAKALIATDASCAESATELRGAVMEIAAERATPPFDGCEHCSMRCLLRREALRVTSTGSAADMLQSVNHTSQTDAAMIASIAWRLTERSDVFAGSNDRDRHLAYCVGIQLCEALGSRADRSELHQNVLIGNLKFSGCAFCPSRCQYGEKMESVMGQILGGEDSLPLKTLWQSRFGRPQETVVADLVKLFGEYAAQDSSFSRADAKGQSVMGFCAALHARSGSSLLKDAGAKAPDPQMWWGETMAEGFGLKNN